MSAGRDDFKRWVAAMTTNEVVAELKKGDPKSVRAAVEDALIDADLTNADVCRLLEAAQKRKGPVKH